MLNADQAARRPDRAAAPAGEPAAYIAEVDA